MIVTCASCLTKFTLDDSKIPAKGAKVRCSKCQHVFFIVPPAESREEQEPIEDFESFAKRHEELFEPASKEAEAPSPPVFEKKMMAPEEGEEEEEEAFLFPGQTPLKKVPQVTSEEFREEESAEVTPPKPKRMARKEKKGPSVIFALVIVLVLLVFGGFYLWTEWGGKIKLTKLTDYLDYSFKKATALWAEIRGIKQEGLSVGDLNRYDEKVGEFSLSVIEGKVKNQSQSAKKHIRVKVVIFDQSRDKVAEKETLCGLSIGREELKNLPPDFFRGEMLVQPQIATEMIIPAGKEAPFMIVFKDLSSRAKEFKVEISEAPDLQ